jgi:hypothetical protein
MSGVKNATPANTVLEGSVTLCCCVHRTRL